MVPLLTSSNAGTAQRGHGEVDLSVQPGHPLVNGHHLTDLITTGLPVKLTASRRHRSTQAEEDEKNGGYNETTGRPHKRSKSLLPTTSSSPRRSERLHQLRRRRILPNSGDRKAAITSSRFVTRQVRHRPAEKDQASVLQCPQANRPPRQAQARATNLPIDSGTTEQEDKARIVQPSRTSFERTNGVKRDRRAYDNIHLDSKDARDSTQQVKRRKLQPRAHRTRIATGQHQNRVDNVNNPHNTDSVDQVQRWLTDPSFPLSATVVAASRTTDDIDTMPRKKSGVLPSPEDSSDRSTVITTSSKKSDRSSANPYASDYHQDLQHHNIYIEHDHPLPELTRRAERTILRNRESPELDDASIQRLRQKSRLLHNEAEDVIIAQFAPYLIPAMVEIPDRRLEINIDQPWSNGVPIPFDPSILITPLPLPKPKPDLAFGYAQTAFTCNQLGTIELLVDDDFGRSFAVPDQKLRFPFLSVEFKSQAKGWHTLRGH